MKKRPDDKWDTTMILLSFLYVLAVIVIAVLSAIGLLKMAQ